MSFVCVRQGKSEWESDSGRMLTLRDVEMSTLSQVELQAFQRVAVNQLQAMNIPVSHAVINGKLSIVPFPAQCTSQWVRMFM